MPVRVLVLPVPPVLSREVSFKVSCEGFAEIYRNLGKELPV